MGADLVPGYLRQAGLVPLLVDVLDEPDDGPGARESVCAVLSRAGDGAEDQVLGGIPVDLRDAVTSLDDGNIARLATAILHASGKRPESSGYW